MPDFAAAFADAAHDVEWPLRAKGVPVLQRWDAIDRAPAHAANPARPFIHPIGRPAAKES